MWLAVLFHWFILYSCTNIIVQLWRSQMSISPCFSIYCLHGLGYLSSIYTLVMYKIVIIPNFIWQSLPSCPSFLLLKFQIFLVLWTKSCASLGFFLIFLPLWALGHCHCCSGIPLTSQSLSRLGSQPESSNLCVISVTHLYWTTPLIFLFC